MFLGVTNLGPRVLPGTIWGKVNTTPISKTHTHTNIKSLKGFRIKATGSDVDIWELQSLGKVAKTDHDGSVGSSYNFLVVLIHFSFKYHMK